MPKIREHIAKGQIPLPFKEKPPRKRKFKPETIKRAAQTQALYRNIREVIQLIESRSRIIISNRFEIERGSERELDTLRAFLKKFNPAHGPTFHISAKDIKKAQKALRLLEAKWRHVFEDAKGELEKEKRKRTPMLPFGNGGK